MKRYLVLTILIIVLFGCTAHLRESSVMNDELIDINSLKADIEFLSSDELEGREAGTQSEKLASLFITSELKKYGIEPFMNATEYFQNINLRVIRFSDKSTFALTNERNKKILEFEYGKNFIGSTSYYDQFDTTAKIVFVGYGITAEEYNYDDYADVNVEGKIVLIYPGEPQNDDSTFFEGKKQTIYSSFYRKVDTASEHGALAIICMPESDKESDWRFLLSNNQKGKYQLKDKPVVKSTNRIPYIIINKESFSKLLDFSPQSYQQIQTCLSTGKTLPSFELSKVARISWMFDTTGTVEVRNVIGKIEGTDPELKHEYIGIGAHYDHIGVGINGINNGADDNASGTAALLEIARAFSERKENKRTILIAFHTAEEKGSLGSQYLAKDTSITNNMDIHINMDMIGRGSADTIYCLGSDKLSSELYDFVESVNKRGVNIYLDYSLNDPNDPHRFYYRSDHYSYARKKVPSVFFFDYEMQDYHRPTDDADKINYTKILRVARLVYELALSAANRESKFKVDL